MELATRRGTAGRRRARVVNARTSQYTNEMFVDSIAGRLHLWRVRPCATASFSAFSVALSDLLAAALSTVCNGYNPSDNVFILYMKVAVVDRDSARAPLEDRMIVCGAVAVRIRRSRSADALRPEVEVLIYYLAGMAVFHCLRGPPLIARTFIVTPFVFFPALIFRCSTNDNLISYNYLNTSVVD